MNSKYNEILKTYLSKKDTDFAIQIDGPWGCGKTFYIENELVDIIKKSGNKVLIISLNGLSKIEDLNSKIFYSCLFDGNKTKNKTAEEAPNLISDICTEILPSIKKLGPFAKMPGLISKYATNRINFSSYVLLFDDLERLSADIKISSVFGFIFDNFTSKGIKTIFVSNETEINDIDYPKRKEKIIRRTISYTPDFSKQLELFFKSKFKNKNEIFNAHKDFFISRLQKKEIRNLRTIAFIFDNFFEVLDSIQNSKLQEEAFEMLFINILLLTDEYKKGNITKEDLKDYKQLNDISMAFFTSTKEGKETYASNFYNTYNKASGLEYIFIKPIFDFIITGCLDKNELIKKLKNIYHPYTEAENTFREIQYFRYKEENELEELVNKIRGFLKSGKYHLIFLPKIYMALKCIQQNDYLESFKDDLKELFDLAFIESSKQLDNIPDTAALEYEDFGLSIETKKDPIFIELINKIKSTASTKQSEIDKGAITTIFETANSKERFVKDYPYGKLFDDIVRNNLIDNFFMLNNNGIAYFQSYIRQNIFNVEKPWQDDKKSRDALCIIKKYIEDNIELKSKNHMHKQRLNELLIFMNDAIACLTEPNKE